MIDTHAHLYLKAFQVDQAEVIARAKAQLSHVVLPNVDLETVGPLKELSAAYSDFCLPLMGLHPCSVTADYEADLKQIEAEFAKGGFWGVGESGLDLYWDKTTLPYQQAVLRRQLALASDHQLPIVLHSREAFTETMELVEEAQNGQLWGIIHCFTGTAAEARRVVDAGFLLGIGGVLTYRNSPLRQALSELGPATVTTSVVLETDAPYLTPVPYMGKRNESSYISYVAEVLAEVLAVPVSEVDTFTSRNAKAVFGIAP